nr:proprotein convertase subtilisin/kexin type 7 [Pogona vitticeps]
MGPDSQLACGGGTAHCPGGVTWAVHLAGGPEGSPPSEENDLDRQADELAKEAGLVNLGRIGELRGHYLLGYRPASATDLGLEAIQRSAEAVFVQHDGVRWHAEQRLLKRSKRALHFNDPKFPQQWHLSNRKSPGMDINVTGVWERNVTGQGVTVVVVDDGVEHTVKDIQPNYSPEGSYDLNSGDPDPMPHPDEENGNHHGTRCAGEIAAVSNNSFCAVGVAYGSRIAGIRVLDGPLTDSMEAVAFNKHYQINDIYSCSWGPDDDGKTVDGPHQLGKAALQHGVMAGRRGFGSIFVVASGNGGHHKDNCNYDGYANSIYTVTVGAVDETGSMPFYAEECASMLAVTFSGGDKLMRSIVSRGASRHSLAHLSGWAAARPCPAQPGLAPCSRFAHMTSLAPLPLLASPRALEKPPTFLCPSIYLPVHSVPLPLFLPSDAFRLIPHRASGVCWAPMGRPASPPSRRVRGGKILLWPQEALGSLPAERPAPVLPLSPLFPPSLPWQYEDHRASWDTNQAGLSHSHQHGFGLLKAWRLVNAAKVWESVPYLASYVSPLLKENRVIPLTSDHLEVAWNVTEADLALSGMKTLEHVAVTVTVTHPRRGNLVLSLFCPSGMSSLIGTARSMDSDPNGFLDWTFSTVRCWGEEAKGTYRLQIQDVGDETLRAGVLKQWQLTLYGSSWAPEEIKERQRRLEEAMSGQYLEGNFSLPCPPGLQIPEQEAYALSTNTLKTLMLLGCFAIFWTFYYLLEVFLTRHSRAHNLPGCGGGRPACRWYPRGRRALSLEDGAEEEEVVPLYGGKEVGGEAEPPLPGLAAAEEEEEKEEEEERLDKSLLAPKALPRERPAEPPGPGAAHLTQGFLTADRERQGC